MICSKCGKEIQEGQKFCVACGTPVAGSESADKSDEAVSGQNAPATSNLAVPKPFWRKVKEALLPKKPTLLSKIWRVLLWIYVIIPLRIVVFLLKKAIIFVPLFMIVWFVSRSGSDMEKQSKQFLKETIQENLLEENDLGKYIALDKIEDVVVKEDPSKSGKWTGTANVTYKSKRGKKKSATIGYEFTVTRKGDEWEFEGEAEDGIDAKFLDLLESAGYKF